MLIPPLFRLFGLIIIMICSSIRFFLFQLHILHQPLRGLVVAFQLGLLTHFNCFGEISLLLICFRAARVGLRTIFKGSHVGLPNFYRFGTGFDAFIVIFGSEVHGSLVINECHVSWVQGDCFVVRSKGVVKFLGFVKLISAQLAFDCSLLIFLLLSFQGTELGQVLFLLFLGRLGLFLLCLRFRTVIRAARLCRCFGRLIFVHLPIPAQRHPQNLHHLRITQHLCQRIRILLQLMNLGHKFLVVQVRPSLWIEHHLLNQLVSKGICHSRHVAYSSQATAIAAGRTVLVAFHFIESFFERRVARKFSQTFFIGSDSVVVAFQ
mmetsp:Transcript_52268/g.111068  ORF Transcript_52268/g.111068 Transcript_52268/m.111068 type:complete len:321 (-) Transcript_52268:312-1274(-)